MPWARQKFTTWENQPSFQKTLLIRCYLRLVM
jgi:hypothetical protein